MTAFHMTRARENSSSSATSRLEPLEEDDDATELNWMENWNSAASSLNLIETSEEQIILLASTLIFNHNNFQFII